MCGIVGILNGSDFTKTMLDSITHRGPDSTGFWSDDYISLGHARLSILGLGAAGTQPMHSASKRFVITFNGEIYNFKYLKILLTEAGYSFRTNTDTEVILAGFELWGNSKTLEMLDGMFAFAVWDKEDKELYLVRDRFGEKPLYYTWIGSSLYFASEIKALLANPNCDKSINESVIPLFVNYSYIPAPQTIYKNIHKLLPANQLRVKPLKANQISMTSFWSAIDTAKQESSVLLDISDSEAILKVESVLKNSVASRLVSEVPVGAFFSGGIDSTAIVSLMSELQPNLKTFTIGFEDKNYNESTYAKNIANYLKTDHTELIVRSKDVQQIISKIPGIYDEPFGDASQIPTFLVSELARKKVKVVLSGDGGDEIFGGYNRYIYGEKLYSRLKKINPKLRQFLEFALRGCNPVALQKIHEFITYFFPNIKRVSAFEEKIQKLRQLLLAPNNAISFFQQITGVSQNITSLLSDRFKLPYDPLIFPEFIENEMNFVNWMMLADTLTYLPNDILTKVDRSAMANGLEARSPFLSVDLFKFAWQLPLHQKIRNQDGKYLLKAMLKQKLPLHLVDRPKMGFSLPLGSWLKTELREWAESLLCESSLNKFNFFSPESVNNIWKSHLKGEQNFSKILWNILMLQSWAEHHGV